jgi:hypothetical protein
MFSKFSSNQYMIGTKEFLNSNSIVAKFAFLILVIVVFFYALRLGVMILTWIFSSSPTPILINGMIDSKQQWIIPQNPSTNGSIPILRSKNEQNGISFSWSTWLYINDLTYRSGQYRHVFHKGNENINVTNAPTGMNSPDNAPGLYIAPDDNTLVVVLNTFKNITEKIEIENIPIKKWFNVVIRCDANIVDIFINGTLTRRYVLQSVVKQNYGDICISMNGGFDGFTSLLRYYNYPIGTATIQGIMADGPKLKLIQDLSGKLDGAKETDYLAFRWYFTGDENSFNV